MKKINYNKEIFEGWTVQDFIDELESEIDAIMTNKSWVKSFKNKAQLKCYCMDNQPYYKKYIPEVVEHFANKYNIK